MKKARVFEETYLHYLSLLAEVDLCRRGGVLGAEVSRENEIFLSFYNRKYRLSHQGIVALDGGETTFPVKVVLSKYLLMCPDPAAEASKDSRLVSYREFKDGAPLISYFTANTNKTIETSFAGRKDLLQQKGVQIGGIIQQYTGYDVSFRFFALPRIPVILNFNDEDEEFPAKCSLLYQSNAGQYLDMECLAITGTYLTSLLISESKY